MPTVSIDDFRVAVPDAVLDDLRARLVRTRFPSEVPGGGWSQGTPRSYLEPLVRHWADGYDWRSYQDRVNSLPQQAASLDGQPVHFFHIPCDSPDALPLLLLHDFGHWGGEYLDVVGPLAAPPPGAAGDGFHLVVPSLPGFAFSGPLEQRGWGPRRAAQALADLMDALGYERYGVAGHGLGGVVLANLADLRPESVVGLHLTAPPEMRARQAFEEKRLPEGIEWDSLSESDQAAMDADAEWCRWHFAPRQTLRQLPQSIGTMLENSPAAIAAWTASYWRQCWADPTQALETDRLLDCATTMWVTESVTSSARMLHEFDQAPRDNLPFRRVSVPTAVQRVRPGFPHTPRCWVERAYHVTRWTEEETGGQFPALECPSRLVGDLRGFFRDLR
jgi:microsomal epoxide hydrolase